jgi:uncharacterized membrane protein
MTWSVRLTLAGLIGLGLCILAWFARADAAAPSLTGVALILAPLAALFIRGIIARGNVWSGLVALSMVGYVGATVTEVIANPQARLLAVTGTLCALAAFVGACIEMRAAKNQES